MQRDTIFVIQKDTLQLQENNYSITEDSSIDSFAVELGFIFSFPFNGPNLSLAVHSDELLYRVSGFIAEHAWTAQLDCAYKFYQKKRTYLAIALNAGVLRINNTVERDKTYILSRDKWDYLGLSYQMNSWGFMFQLGLTIGVGTYQNPFPFLQFGYSAIL